MAINALINLSDADAGWGTVYYNGYTFTGLRQVEIRGEEVYDQAQRVVVFTRYKVRVHFFPVDLAGLAAHTTAMTTARRQLQEPGGILRITGQGFGDIYVNDTGVAGNRADVEFGPKPSGLELTQIGYLASECVWECSFSIKEGAGAQGNLAAFCYDVAWSYDDAGLCTRTISGYLQVLISRAPSSTISRVVTSSAEFYRQQIRVATPAGFQRGDRRFALSQDRTRLDFTLSDRQLSAEPPLPNCLRCDLDWDIESVPPGFAQFNATLAGTIEVPSGTATIKAAEAFMKVFIDRQLKLSQAVGSKGVVMPLRIRFGRTLGSRESRFAVSWLVTGCLDDLLKNGGIWDPVAGTNWTAWAQSMALAWSNRGSSNLAYNSSEDVLVDLNYTGGLNFLGPGSGPSPPEAKDTKIFAFNVPPENSWIKYENTLVPMREHQAVTHWPAETYTPKPLTAGNLNDTGIRVAEMIASNNTSVTQYWGRPMDHILMRGKAMRVQHQPSIPRLVSVGGKRVQEIKAVYEGPKPIACIFGKTVFTSRWAILYRVVDGYLGTIPEQKNPALCCAAEVIQS